MEITKLDAAGIAFLSEREGLRLKPYLDTKGIPTISIGCTYYADGRKVTMNDKPLTKDEAINLFRTVVKHYELGVYSVTRDDINQNQFNALVSFTYNVGISGFKKSTLLKRVNAKGSDDSIKAAFMMWTKNKELKGRREKEVILYFT